MGRISLNISGQLEANIAGGDREGLVNNPIMIDPVTESFSKFRLVKQELSIINPYELPGAVILNNGKNSRFSARTKGEYQVELYMEDERGNTDTDKINIIIQ